jgi:diguanylate cyclase (GGDEF)-like protein
VASAVRQRLRVTDHLFRSGGDEFVVVATDCNGAAAHEMAEELQALVSQLRLASKQELVPTSITTGISSLEGDELKPDILLARSDADLRHARQNANS